MSNLRMTQLVVLVTAATVSSAAFAHRDESALRRASPKPEGQRRVAAQALDRLLPSRVEPVYRALDETFEPAIAMETVIYMQQFWRIAGNPGFNSSIDFIRTRLVEGGVRATTTEFKGEGHGWAPVSLTLGAFTGDEFRVSLAVNSFSTAGDLHLRLIDVGEGTSDADYEGKVVEDALVLASARARAVWEQAVVKRGAAGIVSSYVPAYNQPADTPGIVNWESVPYDASRRAFAIKVSHQTAARLRQHAATGDRIRVNVQTAFHELPTRTLIAEIPGRTRPDERIVMVAHVQEPGANDDASGCGTLLGMARALARGIAAGRIPPPERTLTFLWVDEIRGSEQWLKEDPERARKVQYMFSLDMTGEDTTKTGGTFLIEKQPDPSAVWARPSDPHSEWGAGEVKQESLKGSLLNDVHLAMCLRRARDTGWVVRTNPYEGGSDHTVFGRYGIPSLLDWHFTDRYYHTNMDTADKTSPAEMKNVGVAVAASAWLLASANTEDAKAIGRLIEAAAAARFVLEARNGEELLAAGKSSEETERQVIAAWKKWYGEARESVQKLPIPNSQIPRR
jgi:aminopeptidase YwaD